MPNAPQRPNQTISSFRIRRGESVRRDHEDLVDRG